MMKLKKKDHPQRDLSISTMRALCIDMINKAKSGHPGMALDAAPIMYALFHDHLIADPTHPDWINRDRFVLSSGHASSLLYATMHLCGYPLSIEDLKSFRQLGSKTAGHPEYGLIPGIDATSGPLGQGIAQAVGMAIAEKAMASQYEEGEKLINHHTYCLCGDGCLEEGLSQEAISLAGQYRLNKLILIYDENGATLDGPTSDSLTENIKLRFFASNWNVLEVGDGNNLDAISKVIEKAKAEKDYPTLIIVHTKIGYGSKNEGSHKTHGEPLGEEDGAYAKSRYGYTLSAFEVDPSVYEDFASSFARRGQSAYNEYKKTLNEYACFHGEEYKNFLNACALKLEDYALNMPEFADSEATRASSGKILAELVHKIPFTLGGSADVAGSVKTSVKGLEMFSFEHPSGRDMHFGIREFAMASAANGMALHKGILPYIGSFFVFSDYMKAAIRMACLEKLQVLYLFSHDSIAVGEDGPTHQPIEQLVALRAIPNLDVIRPADGKETFGAYLAFLNRQDGPTALILSRQNLPQLAGSDAEKVKLGAYVIYTPSKTANLTLLATGSEVALAIEVSKILEEKGIYAEVVSMPSWRRFELQSEDYKKEILHLSLDRRVSIEMSSTLGWAKYAGLNIGVDSFGASGKAAEVLAQYGFNAQEIAIHIGNYLESK